MGKRIAAMALVIVMVIALLPLQAFAVIVPITLSINGKYFTGYDQTLQVGGGTATLSISDYGYYPLLTLKNVNISRFAEFDTGDGNTVYAGIAFSGETVLHINLEGNNTITAPTKKAAGTYVGIFSDTSAVIGNPAEEVDGELSRASLTINNADIGIVGLESPSHFYMYFSNIDLKINNASKIGIQGDSLDFHGCSTSISSKGCGIAANSVITTKADYTIGGAYNSRTFSRPSPATINVSSATVPESGSLVGVQCGVLSCEDTFDINVSYKCKGNEKVFCCGVNSEDVSAAQRDAVLNTTVNLQGNENSYAVGILTDKVALYSTSIFGFGKLNVNLNLSGKHGQSMGIAATDISSENSISSRISGAGKYDIPVCTDKLKLTENGALYAGTDYENPEFGALLLKSYEPEYNTTIYWPDGGFADTEIDGETVRYCADKDGRPAQYFVANHMGYPFVDIDDSGAVPYKSAILWAVGKSITNGVLPMEFRPFAECSRGQVVTFLWRAMGCPEPGITENPFVDVSADSHYYKAILWALEQGITTGYDETHFSPDKTCSRGQVVTFLWRCEGRPEAATAENPFVDISAGSPYYKAILWAAEQGITTGYDATHFSPDKNCTRGQVVTFIYRDMHEQSMNAKGNLTDVIIDVDPDEVFEKSCYPEIRLSSDAHDPLDEYAPDKKDEKWDFVPVNLTYVFENGSCDNVTAYLKCPIVNGELSVSENWVQLVTVKGTKAYLTYGLYKTNPEGKSGYLLVMDAKKATAEFVRDFSGEMQAYGDYIVATAKGSRLLEAYCIADGKHGKLQEDINFVANANVTDYAVHGDYLLYWCNTTAEGIRVGGIYMSDIDSGYGHRFGDYYHCKSFTHDDAGFTVVYQPNLNSPETVTEYIAYPAK